MQQLLNVAARRSLGPATSLLHGWPWCRAAEPAQLTLAVHSATIELPAAVYASQTAATAAVPPAAIRHGWISNKTVSGSGVRCCELRTAAAGALPSPAASVGAAAAVQPQLPTAAGLVTNTHSVWGAANTLGLAAAAADADAASAAFTAASAAAATVGHGAAVASTAGDGSAAIARPRFTRPATGSTFSAATATAAAAAATCRWVGAAGDAALAEQCGPARAIVGRAAALARR